MRFILAAVAFVASAIMLIVGGVQYSQAANVSEVTAVGTTDSAAPITVISHDILASRAGTQSLELTGEGDIFVAVGRTEDVTAWVGDALHNTVSLADDTENGNDHTTQLVFTESGTEATVPNPAGNDLWFEEHTGVGSLDLELVVSPGYSVLIASDGTAPAPNSIEISWPFGGYAPLVGPLLTAGAILLVVAIALMAWALLHRRSLKREQALAAKRGEKSAAVEATREVDAQSTSIAPWSPVPWDDSVKEDGSQDQLEFAPEQAEQPAPGPLPWAEPASQPAPVEASPAAEPTDEPSTQPTAAPSPFAPQSEAAAQDKPATQAVEPEAADAIASNDVEVGAATAAEPGTEAAPLPTTQEAPEPVTVTTDLTGNEEPTAAQAPEQAAPEQAAPDQGAPDQPVSEQAAPSQSAADQPAADQPTVESSDKSESASESGESAETSKTGESGETSKPDESDETSKTEEDTKWRRPRGRNRSSAPKRQFFVAPLMVVASLTLAGCAPQYWPAEWTNADIAPTGTPTSTVEAALIEEGAMPPTLNETQLEHVISDAATLAAEADTAMDASILEPRFTADALQNRTATYKAQKADDSLAGPVPFPTGDIVYAVPEATDTWPRVVFAVVNPGEDAAEGASPAAVMLVQEDARANFKVASLTELAAGVALPEAAPVSVGAPSIANLEGDLVMAPDQLAAAYADIIAKGDAAEFADLFDPTNDTLRAQVNDAYREGLTKELDPEVITISFAYAATDTAPIGITSIDGGAIVAVSIAETETLEAANDRALITVAGRTAALSGVETSETGFIRTYTDELLFYVPSAETGGTIQFLGVSQSMTDAKEIKES